MAEFPAMPLWTDAYLSDTAHLSEPEHGRYLLLLMFIWRAPKQRLPNNDAWLARKFSRDEEWVRSCLRPIIKEFCTTDGNWLWQKRLRKEFAYVANYRHRQSERAKSRWDKEKATSRGNAALHASGNAASGNAPTPLTSSKEEDSSPEIPSLLGGGARKKNARPRTRWSSDRVIPDDWKVEAAVRRAEHGLPSIDLDLEADAFGQHWLSTGDVKADWRATWMKWILKARQTDGRKGKSSAHESFALGGLLAIRDREPS